MLPFCFNPLYLSYEEAINRINKYWNTWIPGTPLYIWEKKLKLVKKSLKEWSKEAYISPTAEKYKIRIKLEELQTQMEDKRSLSGLRGGE